MTNTFVLSIVFLVVYRVFSAYKVWQMSDVDDVKFVEDKDGSVKKKATRKRWWRVLAQLWELEIFEILYLSDKYGLKGDSAPQRMLALIVAVVEAGPEVQSLFQCVTVLYLSLFRCGSLDILCVRCH